MNGEDTSPYESLSLQQMQAINARCNAFEKAWKAGGSPSLAAHMADASGDELLALAEQLVAIDIGYRRERSSSLDLAAYAKQLPGVPLDRLRQWIDDGLVTREGDFPERIGDYELIRKIGQGGMGVVFLARHVPMDRQVALKVIKPELLQDPIAKKRFALEMKIAGRLRHPNVVTAYDARDEGRYAYLAMEYVDGVDLQTLVRRDGPLPWRRALEMVRQAAAGLAYLHAQKMVHRDVKPSNLLLDLDGVVRVADVGLARIPVPGSLEQSLSQASGLTTVHDVTSYGVILGTVDCMAPEQAANSAAADARSDVYSLGCTLYILLTGTPPFVGETILERLLAHRERPVPTVRSAVPDLPNAVDAFVQQMLAKSPRDRPANMEHVVASLGKLLEGEPVPVNRPSRFGFGHAAAILLVLVSAAVVFFLIPPFGSIPNTRPNAFSNRKPPTLSTAPFDAKTVQKAWADALGVPVEIKDSLDISFVLIPPGVFTMGMSPEQIESFLALEGVPEFAEHLRSAIDRTVTVEKAFYLSRTEITKKQFAEFVRQKDYRTVAERPTQGVAGWGLVDGKWTRRAGFYWSNHGDQVHTDEHPVGNLTFKDAEAFCRWASTAQSRTYRLPTEAEWEFACRAGTTTVWDFGDDEEHLEDFAWYKNNAGAVDNQYRPVAKLRPNGFGLYDMIGNLVEWCQPVPAVALLNDQPLQPVLRGGRFADPAHRAHPAVRIPADPLTPDGGLRVVLELPIR